MNLIKLKKNLFLLIFLFIISNCNYKPLLNKNQLGDFKFGVIEVTGNKRISQAIVNKLNIVKDQKGNLVINIYGEKKVSISNKSTTGKALEYSVTLSCNVEVKDVLSGLIIYSKNIVKSEKYKPTDNYSDTINSEKKIVENISSLIAKQILNEISLALRDDI